MIYLPPSAAKRWLKCTASPGFIERNRDRLPRESSFYADEGTEAHDYASAALELGGLYDYSQIPDVAMATHVKGYVEFVLAQQGPGETLIVEEKVPLFYLPKRNGKVDAAIVGPRKLRVSDLKYGAGISVEAVDNVQLAIYARSLVDKLIASGVSLPIDAELVLAIYQPRAQDGRVVREWSLTLAELYTFCEPISSTAAGILLNPDKGEFYPEPEEVCRFCDAKPICGAYAQKMLGELPSDIIEVQAEVISETPEQRPMFPAVESLTLEQIAKVMTVESDLRKWLDAVWQYGANLHNSGTKVPGFKMVAGQGSHRKWKDDEEAEKVLRQRLSKDEVFSQKLITPAQAEKLLKGKTLSPRWQKKFEALIIKPEGAPTMVPESDPREPLQLATSVFENITPAEELI